jgi:hypothetical protein
MTTTPLVVTCPACDARLRLPGVAAGKRVRCPKCKAKFDVADPALPPPPEDDEEDEPVWVREDRVRTPYHYPDEDREGGSRVGLWIGLGVGALALTLVTVGVALWTSGRLSKASTVRQGPVAVEPPSPSQATAAPAGWLRIVSPLPKPEADRKANPDPPAVARPAVPEKAKRKDGLTDQQLAAARAAVQALSRMESRNRVMVRLEDYRRSLQETQIAFDEAQRALPPGPLLDELRLTMTAYIDGAIVLVRLEVAPSVPLFRSHSGLGVKAGSRIIDDYHIKFDLDESALAERKYDSYPRQLINLAREGSVRRETYLKVRQLYQDLQREIEADTRRAFRSILTVGSGHLDNARRLVGD